MAKPRRNAPPPFFELPPNCASYFAQLTVHHQAACRRFCLGRVQNIRTVRDVKGLLGASFLAYMHSHFRDSHQFFPLFLSDLAREIFYKLPQPQQEATVQFCWSRTRSIDNFPVMKVYTRLFMQFITNQLVVSVDDSWSEEAKQYYLRPRERSGTTGQSIDTRRRSSSSESYYGPQGASNRIANGPDYSYYGNGGFQSGSSSNDAAGTILSTKRSRDSQVKVDLVQNGSLGSSHNQIDKNPKDDSRSDAVVASMRLEEPNHPSSSQACIANQVKLQELNRACDTLRAEQSLLKRHKLELEKEQTTMKRIQERIQHLERCHSDDQTSQRAIITKCNDTAKEIYKMQTEKQRYKTMLEQQQDQSNANDLELQKLKASIKSLTANSGSDSRPLPDRKKVRLENSKVCLFSPSNETLL